MNYEPSFSLANASVNLRRLSWWLAQPNCNQPVPRIQKFLTETERLLNINLNKLPGSPSAALLEKLRTRFNRFMLISNPEEKAEEALYLSVRFFNLAKTLPNNKINL